MASLTQSMAERARAAGPLAAGHWRVVVLESSGRWSVQDFEAFDAARGYADDAASEDDDVPPVAQVFDAALVVVAEGRHYAAR